MNRFKGLELVSSMPEELWMEVCNIVQEAANKTIPKKKKSKKAKWLSKSESCSVVSDSLQPHGLCSPWNSPGHNTGVDSLSLLQWIFKPREQT